MALRWGIIAAGKIANDFVTALGTLPADEHKVVAIAARDKVRAEEFAKKHEIPKAFGSYKELAESADVDIIHIGVLNPWHYDVAILMLDHGKHVLVEKPLCINEKQARKLIAYAERKKVFLVEGVWSRFFPSYHYIRQQIASGALGEIESVDATFGSHMLALDRLTKKELGGGTILDIGVYVIQMAQFVFQEPPIAIKATGELNSDGVDVYVEAELQYSGGRVAKIRTTSKTDELKKAVIKGSKGQITLNDFWCATNIIDVDGKEKEWVLPKGKHKLNYTKSEGLRFEAQEVRKCILEGKLESELMSHKESILLAHIEDSIRKQIGVVFPEDQ